MRWGINARFFSVNGVLTDYDFTGGGTGSSPYDETISWNSSEGVVMDTEYKLYGRVSDPWVFFLHFDALEHDFKVDGKKDVRVYAALRVAGKYIAQLINEETCKDGAENIRTNPDGLKIKVLPKVQTYMKQFGFEITDIMFLKNFSYPNGNVIAEARTQITEVNSEIRVEQQNLKNKTDQIEIKISEAKIAANTKIMAAKRAASQIDAESTALANALKQSIDQVGIDGTLKLKMTEQYGQLTKSGVLPDIWLNEDSIFAAPFYRGKVKVDSAAVQK